MSKVKIGLIAAALLLGFTIFSGLAFTQAETGGETPSTHGNQDQIGEIVDAWVGMWNSYDLSKVDELFLAVEDATYFSSEKEGLIRGIKAIREHHRGFGFVAGGKDSENRLWLEDLVTQEYGDTAVVTGIWFFGRAGEAAEKVQRGPMTLVLKKTEEGYRIAHMHFANY
jgi:ketosteroid isomerase-like protein